MDKSRSKLIDNAKPAFCTSHITTSVCPGSTRIDPDRLRSILSETGFEASVKYSTFSTYAGYAYGYGYAYAYAYGYAYGYGYGHARLRLRLRPLPVPVPVAFIVVALLQLVSFTFSEHSHTHVVGICIQGQPIVYSLSGISP